MPLSMTRGLQLATIVGAAISVCHAAPAQAHGFTERVSLGPCSVQANGDSSFPAISADGRFIAFLSYASNLVPGDTNAAVDVLVRDRHRGKTERVNVGPGGVQGNGSSSIASISAKGRFVAFDSDATNLVPGDTNGSWDIFVRDRRTGSTERVSIGPGGIQANGDSNDPAISADGRFVTFLAYASNLVPRDTNGSYDVFVDDRKTGRTERVSIGPGGVQANGNSGFSGPMISADGRFVAFDSAASNLVPRDTNGTLDVFVRIPAR